MISQWPEAISQTLADQISCRSVGGDFL